MKHEAISGPDGGGLRAVSVKLPSQGIPRALLAGAAAVAAIALFLVLESRRGQSPDNAFLRDSTRGLIASPPELRLPADEVVTPTVPLAIAQPTPFTRTVVVRPESLSSRAASPPSLPQRPARPETPLAPAPSAFQTAPVTLSAAAPALFRATSAGPSVTPTVALVVDRGVRRNRAAASTLDGIPAGSKGQFTALRPEPARSGANLLAVGSLIPAVLETPLDTSRGGTARALVSKDTRSEDGQSVLVPKGSRLIGQYGSDAGPGQNRVLVTWNRLVLPDGQQVKIDYPTDDPSGAPGLKGTVHSNFLARFAGSLLQTALNIATFRAIDTAASGAVVVGLPTSVGVAGQALQPSSGSHRRITVPAGTELSVFVSQDIDFSPGGNPTPDSRGEK